MTSAAKWSLGEVVMTGELEHGEAGAGGGVKDGGKVLNSRLSHLALYVGKLAIAGYSGL